jgi:hypothetical protein
MASLTVLSVAVAAASGLLLGGHRRRWPTAVVLFPPRASVAPWIGGKRLAAVLLPRIQRLVSLLARNRRPVTVAVWAMAVLGTTILVLR